MNSEKELVNALLQLKNSYNDIVGYLNVNKTISPNNGIDYDYCLKYLETINHSKKD